MTTLQGKQIPNPNFSNPRTVLGGPEVNIADNTTNLKKETKGKQIKGINLDLGNGCCDKDNYKQENKNLQSLVQVSSVIKPEIR